MTKIPRWVDRTFTYEHLTAGEFPFVVERLRGTPARVADKLDGLPSEALTRRDGESWSLQEHLGHLIDSHALIEGRLDDYLAGASDLRAADLANRRTQEARHNERDLDELLDTFRRTRGRLVARLDAWDPKLVLATARHPRLGKPMRVVDQVFFMAEHDDQHLTVMTELARRAGR